MAHLHAREELPGAGAAERRQDDQRAAQRAPGALEMACGIACFGAWRNAMGFEKHRVT